MRAVIFDEFGGDVRVGERPEPAAPPGGVVVEVRATGLCRSDWHAWAGHDPDIAPPHVPGHELAGVVTEVGPGVTTWAVGDRVTTPFVCGCGTCEWCARGDAQVCPDQTQPGFTHDGSFAERVVLFAAEANLVRIPDDVSFEAAAALGCRFATAYRGLVSRARLEADEWLVVYGAGGVGLSAVMIATALGARVVAVDRSPAALATAAALGAEATIDSSAEDAPARATEITGGGAHVSVDAVGLEQTCADAIGSLRRRGRHVQIGLLPGSEGHPRVPMDRVIAWEIDVLGSHGMSAADYPGARAHRRRIPRPAEAHRARHRARGGRRGAARDGSCVGGGDDDDRSPPVRIRPPRGTVAAWPCAPPIRIPTTCPTSRASRAISA